MSWGTVITVGGALLGGHLSAEGSRDAADAVAGGSNAAIAENRRQFDLMMQMLRPSVSAGNTARNQLMTLLGLDSGHVVGNAGRLPGDGFGLPEGGTFPNYGGRAGLFGEDVRLPPGSGGRVGVGRLPPSIAQQLGLDTAGLGNGNAGQGAGQGTGGAQDPLDIIRNTPGYNFRLEQGARALNANRSAGGSSGGDLLRDFARFNQGVASDFYTDYANRLAAIAGLGQTAASNAGSLGIQSAGQIGNALQNAGSARASGILGAGNAYGGAVNDIFRYLGSSGLFDRGTTSNSLGVPA